MSKYTVDQVRKMREQAGKIGGDQKRLGDFMKQYEMPHNVTIEKFVREHEDAVGIVRKQDEPEQDVEVEVKPPKPPKP